MKKLIAALFLVLMTLTTSGCPPNNFDLRRYESERVNNVIKSMSFFKHPTSGLCFSYFYLDGPAMAEVPCQKVEHLLVNK